MDHRLTPGSKTLRKSYAQNFEDVMLMRAFGAQADGRYIDVGAADPERYSITRLFYERGWTGINIEPHPDLHARLQEARPRDVNLQIALGAAPGHATLYRAEPPELSTLDPAAARVLEAQGRARGASIVTVDTLSAVVAAHCPGETVDFLSVDAEGRDGAVLAGADFTRFRPRVIIVEATRPQSFEPSHEAWEPALLAAGYSLALFDGLNRFYLRAEDAALRGHFQTPAGIADGFVPYELFKASAELDSVQLRVADLTQRTAQQDAVIQRMGNVIEAMEREVYDIRVNSLRARLRPRLGILRQYPPRIWTPPAEYARAVPPDDPPSISIVTPVRDQKRWIAQAIDSVTSQGYPRLEYIVRDGASSDGTAALIEARAAKLTSWASVRDRGQADAINQGFAATSGEIMGWLNGDDQLMPGALAYVARYFRDHPKVDLVYGHRIVIDESGRQIGHWVLPPHDRRTLQWADFVPQETMFWRRRVWEKVGPLDETFEFALDWDFLLRIEAAGFTMRRLPRFLGCFRVHDTQKTGNLHAVYEAEAARLRQRSFGRAVTTREIDRAIRPYLRRHVLFERAYKLRLLRY